MSGLSLAAIGWVDAPDQPVGNRLRWSWPEDAVQGGQHILPEEIIVERAPVDFTVDSDTVAILGLPAAAPPEAWKDLGDVHHTGFMPGVLSLGGPVQAVQFVYNDHLPGASTLIQAFAGERCILTRLVDDNEPVMLQAAAIDRLIVMSPSFTLKAISTLDLYAPTSLTFAEIARINLGATAATYTQAKTRYPATPTLGETEWNELRDQLWGQAWAEAPGVVGPTGGSNAFQGGPNAFQALQIVLAARWEHAVFCGFGFVDGPDHVQPALDTWTGLLNDLPTGVVAYRVRAPDSNLAPSNVVYVPGAPAPPLVALDPPTIESGAVRLGTLDAIVASWDIAWIGSEPGIVGAHVEEALTVGATTTKAAYDGRGRRDTDPPGSGFLHREQDVGSHHVTVSARLRAQDGFDRIGPPSSWSLPVVLPIDHHPQPPPLRSATNDGSTTILTQSPPAGWNPDTIVAAANGLVRIYRRTADAVRFSAPVLTAVPDGTQLVVTLGGAPPPKPGAFTGGGITIGPVRGTLVEVAWPMVVVEVPYGDGPIPAVPSGATAELTQSPTHPDLFTPVYDEWAKALPTKISFSDPMKSPGTALLIEYRARLVFAGHLGPFGPAVQALRLPAKPKVPPPFKVSTLGVDHYDRTIVQIELTPPSTGLFEVWWADGSLLLPEFSVKAVPGEAGVREAEGGKILFDTLSLPVPGKMARTVTIGVQAVNAADGRSAFMTVVHTLSATS